MASQRRALCVGINHFKNLPNATLQGCVNDAHDMQSLLSAKLGFSAADITVLADAQATKATIMSKLQGMVADAKAGKLNYLVFSLSSHGTQVPDLSGDEPDRADEAFCPHDLIAVGGNWDPAHIITDDELHDLFVQLPANVLLEVYLDTCHSGTGLKALDLAADRRPRYLPPPTLAGFLALDGRRPRGLRHTLSAKALSHNILWAACRSDQTSADAHIAGGWHGAFTYFFCKEMMSGGNLLARKDVLTKVRADLVAGHYNQTPQLEADATNRNTTLA
ncbi:caspase family protein [Paucibacter sp. TC2R-5]|uniref:caspase family protein n=1 Tax=Paucibacter sp. TC2R-5 TaxID=2893555 RepID=UPI0021E3616D|nr:caspase family protein [Paucibacter sp. TC2R-5]MCV2357628.1 caspase family protein [Paucibacter sp. TC2R-5]